MANASESAKSFVISYLALRRAIGILGIALPFVVSLGAWIIFETGMQGSISGYYHTGMRDVFVGALCAIGVFLLAYKGYSNDESARGLDRRLADRYVSRLGGLFAVGMALFPASPRGATSISVRIIGWVHVAFAALFFLTLVVFSLFLFTRTHSDRAPTKRKIARNKVYRACGYTICVCLLLITVYAVLPIEPKEVLSRFNPVYWLEAAAVVAFGISWLTKGKTILRD